MTNSKEYVVVFFGLNNSVKLIFSIGFAIKDVTCYVFLFLNIACTFDLKKEWYVNKWCQTSIIHYMKPNNTWFIKL